MIFGAHVIVFTHDAEADRAFFRDVLELASVDSGGGWLIFEMPPSEIAFHPTDVSPTNEIYLLCDDLAPRCNDSKPRASPSRRSMRSAGAPSRGSRSPAEPRSASTSPNTPRRSDAPDAARRLEGRVGDAGRSTNRYVVTRRLSRAADVSPANAKNAITSSVP